jgi:3-hydroxyisobutyrate dehydrogenase
MGMGMAQSLRRGGFQVAVCDRRSDLVEKFLTEDGGGIACDVPLDLAKHCAVIVSVVVNAAQTEDLLFGEGKLAQAMPKGNLFVMCSTVDPNWSRQLGERLGKRYGPEVIGSVNDALDDCQRVINDEFSCGDDVPDDAD